MSAKKKNALPISRQEDYPQWYLAVIAASELAENSVTRGSMVIRPYGYALWEHMQQILDQLIKQRGHENAYFPLLIPLHMMQKEADHIEGFAKECAVVTHHRLESDRQGQLQPAGLLEEPYIIRPTSEMIIGECFSRWVQSYRDLPLKINQWANVMRWEMRTRMFLRTSEFLWQEGHTAHANEQEAFEHTLMILSMYQDFCRNHLALPMIKGIKPEHEKFPGALTTYCIESLMQDNKALQGGTSHFMGQNFAKSCQIEYSDQDGSRLHAWTTSWGVTTRLVGALIMTHGDDQGLVLPPKIAPFQVVIQPIIRKDADANQIFNYCKEIADELSLQNIRVRVDQHSHHSWTWIKKGVPIRLEIGMKEIEEGKVSYFLRSSGRHKQRLETSKELFITSCKQILENLQQELFESACQRQEQATHHVYNLDDLSKLFEQTQHPGFVYTPLCYNDLVEKQLQDWKASVRFLPLEQDNPNEKYRCTISDEEGAQMMVLARAY